MVNLASGDTTQTSVVLWGDGVLENTAIFEIATDETFSNIVTTTTAIPVEANLPVKVEVENLTPGTEYYYRVAGTEDIGQFETPNPVGTRGGLRFGVSGDLQGALAPFVSIKNADERDLDFFVQMGDMVEADSESAALPGVTQATTLEEFRIKQSEIYSPRFDLNTWADLRATTPVYATWDDHEVTNDFAGGATPAELGDDLFGDATTGFVNDTPVFEASLQAFQEYFPLRDDVYGDTGDERTANEQNLYRYNTFGSDAGLFVLDVRSFRDAPLPFIPETASEAEINQTLTDAFDPDRTLLGDAQLEQFKNDLLAAEEAGITWKFVSSTVPIQNFGIPTIGERWEGYAAERADLLNFIEENDIQNVVFITGDFHGNVVNNVTNQQGVGEAVTPTGVLDVMVGPVGIQLTVPFLPEPFNETFAAPFGPETVGFTPESLLTEQGKSQADYLELTDRADQDQFVREVVDFRLEDLGYDPIGLENSPIDAELIQGEYIAAHTYGWTEFEIDAETQQLTVTTYGVEPYTQAELLADSDAITNLTPEIVSQFTVNPEEEPSEAEFTLQILHASDLEGGVDAIERAPNFAAIIDALEQDTEAFDSTITLSAGDNYLSGPFFSASGDRSFRDDGIFNDFYNELFDLPNDTIDDTYGGLREGGGRVDISIMNAIGFDASALGNHEFDLGTSSIEDIIAPDYRDAGLGDDRWVGAQFPYLSANLDFSQSNLAGLFTPEFLPNTIFQSGPAESLGDEDVLKIAPATIIEQDGERIAVLGATTPLLDSISSPGDVSVIGSGTNDMAELAAILQPNIDVIVNIFSIDKIILTSHLQQIALEEELATLLSGVDVIIAGGSGTRLADENDLLRPGDEAEGNYPILTQNAEGDPVAIVSTDGEYSYVGRLVVEFDADGRLVLENGEATNTEVSGVFATTDEVVTELAGGQDLFAEGTKGNQVQQLTSQVTGIVEEKSANVFGLTSVYLNGVRSDVRTQETNLGVLTAEANLAIAQQYDASVVISIKNGGGIRAPIGEVENEGDETQLLPPEGGEISQLDIENSLRFNNGLTLLTLTAEELLDVLEHAVAATTEGGTPGQFPQIAGLTFSFDATQQAIEFDDDGNVVQPGQRIQNVALTDSDGNLVQNLVVNGQLAVDATREFRIVTLDFLAGGGDSYPFPFLGENIVSLTELEVPADGDNIADFAADGSEQDALAEYLAANFAETPFSLEDTPPEDDTLIQNLAFQQETMVSTQDILQFEGRYSSGIFGDTASESNAYDAASQRLFVVNGGQVQIDILDVSDTTNPTLINSLDFSEQGGSVNTVASANGIIAVAVEASVKTETGQVVFLNAADGAILNTVDVGVLPDLVTFTPDGTKVLVANEGEFDDDTEIDPEGSVSIINIENGVETATVTAADFNSFNDDIETLRDEGVRIFREGSTVAQDVEPEFIAVTSDSTTAYVTLQENNALAVLDLTTGEIADIVALGFKDHSLPENGLDASDRDDAINITNYPNLFGMYQPDAIDVYNVDGTTYIVTANEGDARDFEEEDVADVILDPVAFPNAATLQTDEQLGRLEITNTLGDTDGDGDFDQLYAFGSRSFSIWDTQGQLIFDSEDDIEQITAQLIPDNFNSTDDENQSFDNRSNDKGPEPEGLVIGEVEGRPIAFIGLERPGGIMAYDISNPENPLFVDYINTRNFEVEFDTDEEGDPTPTPEQLANAGDIAPEVLSFITAEESPTGNPLLSVSYAASGTTTLFSLDINTAPVLDNSGDLTFDDIETNPSEVEGTAVSDLIAEIVSDDDGDTVGIAVVGTSIENGTWEFSLDEGNNWTAFNSPSDTEARLLNADAEIRLIPDTDFVGTVDPGLSFRAWDQTLGENGSTTNVSQNGGITAFSVEVETASITINPLNSPPVLIEEISNQTANESLGYVLDLNEFFEDEDDDLLTFTANGLPNGLTVVEDTGLIIGAPTEAGIFNLTVAASDEEDEVQTSFVLEVETVEVPEIPPLPDEEDGEDEDDDDDDDDEDDGDDGEDEDDEDDGDDDDDDDDDDDETVPPVEIEIPIRQPNVVENTVEGDLESNDLLGNTANDDIFGLPGDDTLTGLEADDNLYGGQENDLIFGSQGNDNLYGDQGNDTIFGGVGGTDPSSDLDFIDGGDDNDILFGNAGEDTILGGEGDDTLYGGKDNDLITGEDGDDLLAGDFGDDTLVGGNGSDRFLLVEEAGTDLIADFENNTDVFVLAAGLTFDQLALTQVNGLTQIQVIDTDEVLATLPGTPLSQLGEDDFTLF